MGYFIDNKCCNNQKECESLKLIFFYVANITNAALQFNQFLMNKAKPQFSQISCLILKCHITAFHIDFKEAISCPFFFFFLQILECVFGSTRRGFHAWMFNNTLFLTYLTLMQHLSSQSVSNSLVFPKRHYPTVIARSVITSTVQRFRVSWNHSSS